MGFFDTATLDRWRASKLRLQIQPQTGSRVAYRSAPQVANLGGHPVQPPFKIPESIIY